MQAVLSASVIRAFDAATAPPTPRPLTARGLGGSDIHTRARYVTVSGSDPITSTRVISYTYDPLGRLTAADYSTGESFAYAYDAVGNRTAMTSTTPLSGTVVTTYTYDAANRLTHRAVSDGRAYTYTWSTRGQLLAEYIQGYPVRTFAYDGAGQLVEATVFTLTTRFRYNGLGDRVAVEVVGHGATTYTLDYAAGNRILVEETDAGATLYLYGRDCLGELRDGEWLYYLPDAEGLVRQGTDEQGQVVRAWLFDPDGVVLEGPEGPVSHLVCGGVYDWSTGLIYRGGRYFDPLLGIWLALTPLVVVQSWRGRKKRRGWTWFSLLLLGVGLTGVLTACDNGKPTPTPTTCIEITTPFGPPLGNNVVFVDPPSGGQHPTHPQAQTWSSSDKQTVEPALTDVINNKFGGPTGFGGLNTTLTEFGVSANNPIRLFREPAGGNPNVAASAARPDVTVFNHWFSCGSPLQEALLGHEMTHYWDQAYGYALTTEMKSWVNWGDTATDRGSHTNLEDIAEAVRVYFWNQYDEGHEWTDDDWAGLNNYPWTSGPDQLMLDATTHQPSQTGTIQVYDRYDWLECRFTGNCLKPLTP